MDLIKKTAFLAFVYILISFKSFSQVSEIEYKACLSNFYSLLFKRDVSIAELHAVYSNGGINKEASQMISDSLKKSFYDFKLLEKKKAEIREYSPSFLIKQLIKFKYELTQGLNFQKLGSVINNAKFSNQGANFAMFAELVFPNKKTIYFVLNPDEPAKVIWIYLSSGELLEGKLYNNNPEKLILPGIINDPDGYVNIRKSPNSKSSIIGRLVKDNYFYYTPNSNSEWWEIRMRESASPLGYIHKSRIKGFREFSEKLKQQVFKERN